MVATTLAAPPASTPTRSSINSMVAHWQWMSRPDDQRFLTLESLHEFTSARRAASKASTVDTRTLRLGDDGDSNLVLLGKGGTETRFTNYSFSQLCERIGTRASEWRDVGGSPMPPAVALPALQYRLEFARQQMEAPQAKLYYLPPVVTHEDGVAYQDEAGVMMAFTGPKYGRIYDADVAAQVIAFNERQGGKWHVPAASYEARDPKRATTLYASDHDVWLMLVNTSEPIDDGSGKGPLYKLLIVSNSEVGDARFVLSVGYYSRVCDNRIIWGLTGQQSVSLVHRAGAPERFEKEAMPALLAYGEMSTLRLEDAMRDAQRKHLEAPKGAPDVIAWLNKRGFTQTVARTAVELIQTGNAGAPSEDITSQWNLVQGLTAAARTIPHTDDRVALEREASKLLTDDGDDWS